MLGRMVGRALEEKVGVTKVIDTFREAYDYIIVGAGAAGNVLASRLTEDGKNTVLLLEAGSDDALNANIHIPASATELQQTEFDYAYKSVPQQRASRGLKEKQILYPRGRGLGGSGSINYMSYTRGSRHDYDCWAESGCTGWSYRDILPYFIKSEDNSNADLVKSGYHGRGGPVKVCNFHSTPLVQAFLDASAEMGFDNVDVNGANQMGFTNQQGMMYKGMRWSTAHGYLRPAMERANLDVSVHSIVNQLLFDGHTVTGVEVNKGEEQFKVKANKEVIISAGAIESPKILMLSGIGPREHLDKFQIPIRSPLPVGQNFQDHPMCVIEYMIERPFSVNSDQSYYNNTPANREFQQYLFFSQDYRGAPAAQGAVGFLRSRLADPVSPAPDVMIQMSSSLVGEIFRKIWHVKDEVFDALYAKEGDHRHGMTVSSYNLRPKSRGSVSLKSRSPTDRPLIDPKFLDHPEDARVLAEGVKLVLQLQSTPSLQKVGATLSEGTLPGFKKKELYAEDYIESFVRHQTLTGHHATGTCRMGPLSDSSAVVDPELRVMGLHGLRVVDASVMRDIPSGNTTAPTIAIAEKASDLILGVNSVSHISLPEDLLEEKQAASTSGL